MPLVELVFQPDNPCNTNIFSSRSGDIDDEPLYTVSTDFSGKNPVTFVKDALGRVLGSAEWRDSIRGDKITLGEGANAVDATGWLKKSMVPLKDTVRFEDGRGGKYKWKGNRPGLSLELYAEDDKSQPIARFHKSRTDRTTSPPTMSPAKLVVSDRAQTVLDMVAISFLFLEKNRRVNDRASQSRADALGTRFGAGNIG